MIWNKTRENYIQIPDLENYLKAKGKRSHNLNDQVLFNLIILYIMQALHSYMSYVWSMLVNLTQIEKWILILAERFLSDKMSRHSSNSKFLIRGSRITRLREILPENF